MPQVLRGRARLLQSYFDMSDTINILLAEDERTLAMIIQDTLDGQGFHVTVASDGEEALRLYAASKPDVIVADVMMPRLDGFELVRRIRKSDRLTPVIFLTARSAVNDVVHGFEMGANDYLKKPCVCLPHPHPTSSSPM